MGQVWSPLWSLQVETRSWNRVADSPATAEQVQKLDDRLELIEAALSPSD